MDREYEPQPATDAANTVAAKVNLYCELALTPMTPANIRYLMEQLNWPELVFEGEDITSMAYHRELARILLFRRAGGLYEANVGDRVRAQVLAMRIREELELQQPPEIIEEPEREWWVAILDRMLNEPEAAEYGEVFQDFVVDYEEEERLQRLRENIEAVFRAEEELRGEDSDDESDGSDDESDGSDIDSEDDDMDDIDEEMDDIDEEMDEDMDQISNQDSVDSADSMSDDDEDLDDPEAELSHDSSDEE